VRFFDLPSTFPYGNYSYSLITLSLKRELKGTKKPR